MDFTPKETKKKKPTMNPSPEKSSMLPQARTEQPTDLNVSSSQKRKEKRKDKQCVVCTCCFTSRDRNMLHCEDCNKWQHGICYQIFGPVRISHRCGPCSVRLGLACTSQEIRDFCLKKHKTEQERRDFVLVLVSRRVIDSFLAGEHLGYNLTVDPSEIYLIVRFEVSSAYADRVLCYLMKNCMITYEPAFQVNLGSIASLFSSKQVFGEYENFLSGSFSFVNNGSTNQASYHGIALHSACKVEKSVYETLLENGPEHSLKQTILSAVKDQRSQSPVDCGGPVSVSAAVIPVSLVVSAPNPPPRVSDSLFKPPGMLSTTTTSLVKPPGMISTPVSKTGSPRPNPLPLFTLGLTYRLHLLHYWGILWQNRYLH